MGWPTQVTNYYLPEPQMACLVQVGVAYDSDLNKEGIVIPFPIRTVCMPKKRG